MFLKNKKNRELKKKNTKLRARISNLTSEKAIDKSVYKDELYRLAVDKRIQEENNIKLLYQNMELIKIINEARLLDDIDEIKKILNNAPTSLISQINTNT